MTRAQAEQAVLTGAALVRMEQERGRTLLATGEMGIGNTTTSAAVALRSAETAGPDYDGKGRGSLRCGAAAQTLGCGILPAVNRPDRPTHWMCWPKWEALTWRGCAACFWAGRSIACRC